MHIYVYMHTVYISFMKFEGGMAVTVKMCSEM
jgi:hypothetical protein